MISALLRAVEEVFTAPLRRVVAISLALAAASFAGLCVAVAIALHNAALVGWWPV
ncbi:MAG: hypothetical protein JO204_11215, partial [Alphaproteobacteria bacterium]|nr:hypothetical protein [Alphaproteobacteria bacterium]